MEAIAAPIARFIIEGLFWVLLLVFTLHILFLGYHWFAYGTSKRISLIALASYLSGGAVLFMTIATTLTML